MVPLKPKVYRLAYQALALRYFPGPTKPLPAATRSLPQRTRPAAGDTLLQVKAARKSFGGLVAVNDLSFAKNSGEILGLIGPNGADKST